jgi:hypothetical protein
MHPQAVAQLLLLFVWDSQQKREKKVHPFFIEVLVKIPLGQNEEMAGNYV